MRTSPLFAKFAVTILSFQFGITEQQATRLLLDAAEALERIGETSAAIDEVLALAIDLRETLR